MQDVARKLDKQNNVLTRIIHELFRSSLENFLRGRITPHGEYKELRLITEGNRRGEKIVVKEI